MGEFCKGEGLLPTGLPRLDIDLEKWAGDSDNKLWRQMSSTQYHGIGKDGLNPNTITNVEPKNDC